MFAITIVLLVLGTLLAALGTVGFICVWQAPSHEELRTTRGAATLGRRMTMAGLALYIPHHAAGGPALGALLIVFGLALATYLTKSTNQIIRT